MLERVLSGGQTGADQAGWRAARRYGIATGGLMPKGFKTEDGPRPEFRERFGAREHWSSEYAPRTEVNVRVSDATVVFTNNLRSPGTLLVGKVAARFGRPVLIVTPRGVWRQPASLVHFIRQHEVHALNVAGNRESSFPRCGRWVERYLGHAFSKLGFEEILPMAPRVRRDGEPIVKIGPAAGSLTVNRFRRDDERLARMEELRRVASSSPPWDA